MAIPPFDERGAGPAVLFAHGTMMDRTMFATQLDELSDAYRTIAFDHRARTPSWEGPYTLDDLADDCVELLDSLAIDRCVLGGMSMGGFMALRFALRHQDRLDGLVLIDTLAAAPTSPHEELFHGLKGGGPLPEEIVEWHADIVFGETTKRAQPWLVELWMERWRALTGAAVYWESASWLRREDVAPRLPEIAVPTLVIHGTEDVILPMSGAEEMADRVQRGRLARIPGAGHNANAEQPGAVNSALRAFLDDVYADARAPSS
jgi:pimeloyl-ACP methyl ester carboxylesterase